MNMIEINLKSGNVCTYCMFYITFLQCEQLTDFKPLLMQSSPEFMGKKTEFCLIIMGTYVSIL